MVVSLEIEGFELRIGDDRSALSEGLESPHPTTSLNPGTQHPGKDVGFGVLGL